MVITLFVNENEMWRNDTFELIPFGVAKKKLITLGGPMLDFNYICNVFVEIIYVIN